jgi:3'(2'), 5'-bisphosphate nucleotidase
MQTLEIDQLKVLTRLAGSKIMEIYQMEDFSSVVDFKADDSPLTLADRAAHEVIVKGLADLYPDIPVISEEDAKEVAYEERKNWNYFWLVDPLDGTKEFIKRNGQFTVNIALIHQQSPAFGIVYTPVDEVFYYGIMPGVNSNGAPGAYKQQGNQEPLQLQVTDKEKNRIAVRSSSHAAPEEEEVLNRFNVTETISRGSSLKFCMVAEASADIYYRHGPTMEWDTAAGQAVVEAAGGRVFRYNTPEEPFTYNKETLLNSSFLVLNANIGK